MLNKPELTRLGLDMNTLKTWLKLATAEERKRLCELAKTKRSYLSFLSNADKAYGRVASADMAVRLEAASDLIRGESAEAMVRLPRLLRTDLSPVCRACGFAQRCLGDAAIASEFGFLDLPKQASGE